MLVGRAGECREVTAALDRVRGGDGARLLVTGSPGLGKTALLDFAAAEAAASGLTVLRASGAEFEAAFAWAGLHQLLRPVLGGLDGLPPEQAAALRGALRLGPATGGDPFLVSLALLTLLTQAADSGKANPGLIALVDDAQWLDDPSADALRFAARRLARDQVGLIVAARDTPASRFALDAWPRIDLAGLGPDGMTGLLSGRARAGVAPQVRERLLDYADGNPLALLEIAGALTDDELAGRVPLPDPLPLSPGLEKAFLDQVRRLPADAQRLLLVAACALGDSWDDVRAAARELGLPDRLDELERAQLVTVGTAGLRFRHPLVRSAVISAATSTQRREAHLALSGRPDDDDRRAWHRAAACLGPDAQIAGELDAAAHRASRRSGFAAAAAAFERAAELSPDPGAAARRLVDAGQAAFQAGQPNRARACAERAERLAAGSTSAVPGRAAGLRGRIQLRAGLLTEAIGTLCDGATILAGQDPEAALEMLLDASEAAEYAGDVAASSAISTQARQIASPAANPGVGLLVGIADMLSGRPGPGSAAISAALGQIDGPGGGSSHASGSSPGTSSRAISARWLRWAGTGSLYLGDNRRTSELFRASARLARATGALDFLPLALNGVGTAEQFRGRFADAEVAADEGLRLARETGQRLAEGLNLTTLAAVAAFRGDEERCRQHAAAALELAIPRRFALVAASASWALALLELGLGQAAAALPRLRELTGAGDSAGTSPGAWHFLVGFYSLPDLVDAAARAGDEKTARETLARLELAAASTPGPWLAASLARCRGLLADPAAAAGHQREALRLYGLRDGGFEQARAQLELGEALRRARHRTEARDNLRPALTALEALGARPWAERARAELHALGDAPATPIATPGGLAGLTPQELQIARLVSGGVSNREIASQLFLSARTVEYHLYKIFPKAGVSSRTELARLVLTQDPASEDRRAG